MVVKDKSEVVEVESGIEEGSVVNSESKEVDENVESGSSEEVEVRRSGMVVRDDKSSDKGIEVEGSIVREESKEGTPVLELESGRVTDEKISVDVSVDGSVSQDVGVGELSVPVLDGGASVNDGSSVCVNGGSELTSKEVEREGVDVEKSVGVSVETVEKVL